MWGLIGGSGFEKSEQVQVLAQLNRETPFGLASSGFKRVCLHGTELLFLPRHGLHHELLPSEVNYRANIFALKREGADKLICLSAIGSLAAELEPGDLVVPSQFLDRTKSLRKVTFCGEGLVGHVSLAHPVCPVAVAWLKGLAAQLDFPVHFGQTYVCIEGPYFSTQAESLSYRGQGAQVIGMTAFPEYALAREAGLCYLPCCFVTDFDCWDDSIPHVTIQEILAVMRGNNNKAFAMVAKLLEAAAAAAPAACHCRESGLAAALMTPLSKLSAQQRSWLEQLKA